MSLSSNHLTNLMIDLETLGTAPDTVVLSIGATFFDPHSFNRGPDLYLALDVQKQLDKGRTVTADTLKWWMSQSDAAKKVFSENPICSPRGALLAFNSWIDSILYNHYHEPINHDPFKLLKVWGNGPTFDISILENLYAQYSMKPPWPYSGVRDFRTFKEYIGNNEPMEKLGVNHNALDDAISQAKYIQKHLAKARREDQK